MTTTTKHGTALPPDYYLPDAAYRRLVGKLQRLMTRDHEGAPRDLPSEIMEALGEHAGIWPESVRDDPLAEAATTELSNEDYAKLSLNDQLRHTTRMMERNMRREMRREAEAAKRRRAEQGEVARLTNADMHRLAEYNLKILQSMKRSSQEPTS